MFSTGTVFCVQIFSIYTVPSADTEGGLDAHLPLEQDEHRWVALRVGLPPVPCELPFGLTHPSKPAGLPCFRETHSTRVCSSAPSHDSQEQILPGL